MSFGTYTVGTTANLVVSANANRVSLILFNVGASNAFIGSTSALTTANGIMLSTGSNFTEDSGGEKLYQGDVYIISTSSSDIRYWERTRR